jgi:hypothetical protein
MAMIRQTSVNEVVKLDFASGIRSMMRQDPDVILVGEIRDQETAEMAFRAAMTGHQVYSTLHTNSSIGADPAPHGPRRAARHHGGQHHRRDRPAPGAQALRALPQPLEPRRHDAQAPRHGPRRLAPVYQAVGCARCDNNGYRGRVAIMELFKLDAEIDELIAAAPPRARSARRRRQGLPLARRGRGHARAHGPDEPRGDLARGRPHRPRDLSGAPMALFAYRAVDADGPVSTGNLDATNAIDLELRLKRLGLDLLTFEGVKRSTAARTRNVTRTELITFCFHLSQLLKAGREHHRGAHRPARHRGQPGLPPGDREPAGGHRGRAEALGGHEQPQLLLRQRVRGAGARRRAERQLTEVLDELSENLKWQDEMASQAKKAMIYPLIVTVVIVGVVFVLMTVLVPQLAATFKTLVPKLPRETEVLIASRTSSCAGGTCSWASRAAGRGGVDDRAHQRGRAAQVDESPAHARPGRAAAEDHPRALLHLLRHALPRRHQRARDASTSARRSWATA